MRKTKKVLVLMMSVMLITSSCKKEKTPDPVPVVTTPTTTTTPSTDYYFSGNINSTVQLYESGKNNIFNGAVSTGSTNTSGGELKVSGTTYMNPSTMVTFLDIYIIKNFPSSYATPAEIYAMFKVGSYVYGNEDSNINGAKVVWNDGTKYWSTDSGTASQSGSIFTVTERGAYNGDFTLFTFKGSFSCNLYDGLGNMIMVKDAIFSGQVAPFQ